MQKKKNQAIEFYRFLFCCIIFVLHSRDLGNFTEENVGFNGGYLGVEFFFILSGFLMMNKLEKKPCPQNEEAKYAFHYLADCYNKLYPSYLFSLLLLIAANKLIDHSYSIKTAFLQGLPDVLALQIFWEPFQINRHLWFLSSLIWASFLVVFLVKRNKECFCFVIEPVALFLFIGITYHRFGHIDLTDSGVLWISGIRAVIEIGLGCFLFVLFDYLKQSKVCFSAWLCTGLEITLLCFILMVMYRTRRDYKDYIMILAIAVFVLVTFLEQGYLTKLLDNPLSNCLGSISYEMYLNQLLVINVTSQCFKPDNYWTATALRILFLCVISWLEKILINFVKQKGFRSVLQLLIVSSLKK